MTNEKQLIDVKPLMKNGWHLVRTGESNRFLASMSLADVPTVDAVEVIHSMWTFNATGSGTCQNCHRTTKNVWDYDSWMRYCPDCGARMDGVK